MIAPGEVRADVNPARSTFR